jgi:hypothetical protein
LNGAGPDEAVAGAPYGATIGCAIVAAIAAGPETGPLLLAGVDADAPLGFTLFEPQRGQVLSPPELTASNCNRHD